MKKELDRKYAKVILSKCFAPGNKKLLIECVSEDMKDFVDTVYEVAKEMGYEDIKIKYEDTKKKIEYINNTNIEDIEINEYLDRSIWDECAKEKYCILHIHSYIPTDIKVDPEKMKKATELMNSTRPYYKNNALKYAFPWCIVDYPNKEWADLLFENDPNSFYKLYEAIISVCMADKEDPEKEWERVIENSNKYKEYINNLEADKMHITSDKGTDLYVGMLNNYRFLNMDKADGLGKGYMVNFPSYEIFTCPNFRDVNGVVYNTKPLIFNNQIVDNFMLKFEDGCVVDYKAEKGEEHLANLLSVKGADSLGEFAIVEHDSPISNTGLIFYSTLLDENASIHLALGKGNKTAIKNASNYTIEELYELGINDSDMHVDFMIGDQTTNIEAIKGNEKKLIFKNGKFII